MRILTRLAAAAAMLALAAGVAQAKDWTTVRIAMDATYPPFESLDPSGADRRLSTRTSPTRSASG